MGQEWPVCLFCFVFVISFVFWLISLSCLYSVFWILSSLPFKTHHWSSGSYWLIQMSKHTCNKHVAGSIHACVTPVWLLFSVPLFFYYYTFKKIVYHTYIHACTHSFMLIYIHMCTWTNVYMHAHAHTHTCTHMHAHTHTHMPTYMQRVISHPILNAKRRFVLVRCLWSHRLCTWCILFTPLSYMQRRQMYY